MHHLKGGELNKKEALIWGGIFVLVAAFALVAFWPKQYKLETTNVVEARYLPLAVKFDGAVTKADVEASARNVCAQLEEDGVDYWNETVAKFVIAGYHDAQIDEYFSYPINTYCPEFAK